jgi:hypothetical protein
MIFYTFVFTIQYSINRRNFILAPLYSTVYGQIGHHPINRFWAFYLWEADRRSPLFVTGGLDGGEKLAGLLSVAPQVKLFL